MKRMIWMSLPLLVLLSLSPISVAQSFENMGTVDALRAKQGVIIVNDTSYSLAPDVRVHGNSKLERKTKIAFSMRRNDSGRPIITEIWVLPSSFVFPDEN